MSNPDAEIICRVTFSHLSSRHPVTLSFQIVAEEGRDKDQQW